MILIDWNDFFVFMFKEDFNFLWLINVLIWLSLSIYILYYIKNTDILEKTQKLYKKYALFFACYAISKSFFFFSNYFYDRIELFGVNPQEPMILRIGYIINLIAVTILIFGLERNLFNWKGYIAGVASINTIIIIFAEESLYKRITMYLQILYFITIFIVYFSVARKSAGDIKKYSYRTMIGMGLFFLGIFLDLRIIKNFFVERGLGSFIFILLPLINLIGTIIFFKSVPSKYQMK